MRPSDRSMVGRRVGGSWVFYWLKSLITSSTITAKQSHQIPRETPTLLPPEARGCMLTRKTYTPALEAEAAPILPGVAAHLRAQVARQWARLWSMARSSEKAEGAGPAHYQIEGGQVRNLFESRSARSLRLARNERNFTSICPSKVKSPSAS